MRPYQHLGFDSIFANWELHDILMFVLATGGGKTFTFTEVIREFLRQGKRCMLIAHRTELIEQAWQTLYDAKVMAGIIKAQIKPNYALPTQVCSIQTIARRKKQLLQLPPFNLIVIDEGHHVQDDNQYGAILAMYPDAKVLIVTATPYRLSGDGFLNVVPGKITKLIINATFAELIREGWLVPLRYHIGQQPDLSNVHLQGGEYVEAEAQKAMELVPLVDSYLEHCNGLQGLCFCVNVEHSMSVTDQYNASGIRAAHVDADTPPEERKEILRLYRQGIIRVVCNVAIFTEGTDFPFCQFVQLAAPTKSLSRLFQEIGRGSRPSIRVDEFMTAFARKQAILKSSKPYCLVLDNAGNWKDHPFADEDIDWSIYFAGDWKKKRTKKEDEDEPEYIEVPVYEIEGIDGSGRRKTSDPTEVEGMVLVKVTKEMRANIGAMKHMKEFTRVYEFACNAEKIEKPGYFAYYKYREHCDSNGINIPDAAWRHLKTILVDNIDTAIESFIHTTRGNGKITIPSIDAEVQKIRKRGIHRSFFDQERRKYQAGDRRYNKHALNPLS